MDAHQNSEVFTGGEEGLHLDHKTESPSEPPVLALPAIPSGLDLDLSSIFAPSTEESERVEKVKKRASNVLKLSEENEKLKAELKALKDRLEAAERRQEELRRAEPRVGPRDLPASCFSSSFVSSPLPTTSTSFLLDRVTMSTTATRRPSGKYTDGRSSPASSRRPSIDPARLVPMDKTTHIAGQDDFNVLFIGAGNIMFGSPEGPWNHSFRLEHKLGPRLKVVALIDPATERAAAVLQKKCDSFVVSAYQDTRIYKTLEDFVKAMTPKERPRAIIVGSPPMFRGSLQSGRDIETQILKHFPGVALFIEKPVATGPKEEIEEAYKIAKAIKASNTVCSIGYMLRYLKAVQMMKQIITENNLTIMATIARYACAYESIAKPDWWNKAKSAGPIIEQGTHFCDLSRYFGGEVDYSTVTAHSLEWDEEAGKLSKMQIDESQIAPENRIPRVTTATWWVRRVVFIMSILMSCFTSQEV
ncbi:hypothetical protein AX16_003654 [Volvariella volvacea WC 439]|nr:hypothetical protein AX16_003654 [Volvariella volvacea WC 439]